MSKYLFLIAYIFLKDQEIDKLYLLRGRLYSKTLTSAESFKISSSRRRRAQRIPSTVLTRTQICNSRRRYGGEIAGGSLQFREVG